MSNIVKAIQLGEDCDWIVKGQQLTDEAIFVLNPPIGMVYVFHSTLQSLTRPTVLPLSLNAGVQGGDRRLLQKHIGELFTTVVDCLLPVLNCINGLRGVYMCVARDG